MNEYKNDSPTKELGQRIIDRIESILLEAERKTRPLEIDPYRAELFDLFVMADAAGFLVADQDEQAEEPEVDLSADAVLAVLAKRWGLDVAARRSFEQQTKLPPEHLSKMRILWAFLRMWMEWTYAWKRWPEFHDEQGRVRRPPAAQEDSSTA